MSTRFARTRHALQVKSGTLQPLQVLSMQSDGATERRPGIAEVQSESDVRACSQTEVRSLQSDAGHSQREDPEPRERAPGAQRSPAGARSPSRPQPPPATAA